MVSARGPQRAQQGNDGPAATTSLRRGRSWGESWGAAAARSTASAFLTVSPGREAKGNVLYLCFMLHRY